MLRMRLCGIPQQEVQTSAYSTFDYPEIHLNVDRLNTSNLGDSPNPSSWRDVILPVHEGALKRIVRTFFESGFREALREACASETAETLPKVCYLGTFLMRGITCVDGIKNRICKTNIGGLAALEHYLETREWLQSPIRYIAWHPHCFKLAVAGLDDQVHIYTEERHQKLKNGLQKSITSVAWRPFSGGELAVGCNEGVFVWTIDTTNLIMRTSSNFKFLTHPKFTPVSSIEWNNDGRLLAVASIANSDLLIWNYDSKENTILRRIKLNCALLKWSPDNSCLLSTTTSSVFRVWYTENKWTPERWSVPEGSVQSACWSSCSSVLLFVTSRDSLLYSLHFNEDQMFSGEAAQTATPIADLSKVTVNDKEVGGQPQALCWDPNGIYLAITFKDSPCIAIYTTYLRTFVCNVTPTCFISGFDGEYPSFICFQSKNRFNSDSVLTIGWSSGRIQFFPFANSI